VGLPFSSCMQCAAVSTLVGAISVPPQNCPDLAEPYSARLDSATAHGWSAVLAGDPPTTTRGGPAGAAAIREAPNTPATSAAVRPRV